MDDYIRRFREALEDGRVRSDSATDFNTMARLKGFLEGKADSRQEVHGMITLEDVQARHCALRAQLESLDPAVTGEVPPRERDRARGLLEDGNSDDAAAMAPRRAAEKSRVRRVPAEPLERGSAISAAEAVGIVDDYIRRFREALDEGRVRADGASDFNTMMRLKAFLEGKADSRQEVHGMITLEDMQARHRALRAQLESLDPAVTGEVPPRERDRARGLLEDGSSDDAAMAPKRAPEKSRGRRLPAEQLDCDDAAGIPVASRRRADDGVEPAPRRRVAPHDREDDFPDDELAEGRDDVRRGDARALRRRAREDDHDDDELEDTRVPRHARAVKPADVRALRRRTREELEDGRMPRRARAMEPERATARRLRCASREERASFPDVVYSGHPGRGWEDEPEQTEPGLRRPGRGWR